MSVFTCCWFIKLEFNPACVYITSFIFDAWLFIAWSGYGLNGLRTGRSLPSLVFLAISILLLVMGIWAIINIFSKDKGGFHKAEYVKYRMYAIYGLVLGAIIMLVVWFVYAAQNNQKSDYWINGAIASALPLLIDAAVLHGYHANFGTI